MVRGVWERDLRGYGDCGEWFMKWVNVRVNVGMEEEFVIDRGLMWIEKGESWGVGDEVGVGEGGDKGGKDGLGWVGDGEGRELWGGGGEEVGVF